jgi:hypothetical protein
VRPTWEVDGSALNQIAVYFWEGRAVKVRWIKVGRFIYEKPLRRPPRGYSSRRIPNCLTRRDR